MIISLLFQDPLTFFAWVVAAIVALVLHEFCHAWAAYALGDSTAKYAGRLTLNPLKHLDLWGSLLILVAGIGWAKPVPYNPYNLKNQKWGPALVALAGPGANLFLCFFFGIILRLLVGADLLAAENMLFTFLQLMVVLNIVLLTFNLIPLPPLDGSKLLFALLPERYNHIKEFLTYRGPIILFALLLLDNFFGFSFLGSFFQLVIGVFSRLLGLI